MRIHLFACFWLGLAVNAAAACEPPREIAVNGAQKLSLGLQSYPQTLALNDHEVVLTFDDGPAETTPAVLEALREGCAKATFFLIGNNAEAMPALVKREVEEGHSIGYHSMTHPARTLRLMPLDAAKADIDQGIAAVDKAGFGAAGAAPHSPFFRFPGYADSAELLDYVHGRGLAVLGSDVWASDWRDMTPEAELALIMSRLEKARKGVVLFHDSKVSTAKMLPAFLRALASKGFKVVHMIPGAGATPVADAAPGWTSTTAPIVEKTLKAFAKPEKAAPAAPQTGEGAH